MVANEINYEIKKSIEIQTTSRSPQKVRDT